MTEQEAGHPMTTTTTTLADFLLAQPYRDHPDYRSEWDV